MPGKLKKRIQNIQRKGHIYIFSQTNLQKQKKKKKKKTLQSFWRRYLQQKYI